MPTNRTVTVKSSGGDYNSLSAAIAGEKGNLVSLDRQLTIECYAFNDTTAAAFDSADWTTDATCYILVTVPTTERHIGTYNTSKYYLTNSAAAPLSISNDMFIIVDGLQIHTTSNSHSPINFTNGSGAAADQTIRNCIIRGNANVSSKGLINGGSTGSNSSRNVHIYNNLIYDGYRVTNAGRGIQIEVVGNWYIWNNTIALVGQGLLRNNGSVIAVNNLISATAATASGTFAAGTNYNATSLSTMGYTVTGGGNTNDRTSQTYSFVNSASGHYYLQSTDAGAKDWGQSDPSSGVYSTDILGSTRSGSWDIGAFEYVTPTTRTVTVKTSGGDYTSLANAVAGEEKNLVGTNQTLVIECYAKQDTSNVSFLQTAWITDPTRSILVTSPVGERHSGVYDTTKYRIEAGATILFQINQGVNITIEYIQIYLSGVPGPNFNPLYILGGTQSNITVRNCIIRVEFMSSRGGIIAYNTGNSSSNIYIYNNLITVGTSTGAYGIQIDSAGNWYLYNNTIAGSTGGLRRVSNGTVIAVNNLLDVTTTAGDGTFAAGTNYNRTSVSAMGYTVTGSGNTNDATSQTFTFVNSGASPPNYHLAATDAGAKDQGTSDPGSGLFSNDIDNQERTGSWDVGMDEYVAASARRIFID